MELILTHTGSLLEHRNGKVTEIESKFSFDEIDIELYPDFIFDISPLIADKIMFYTFFNALLENEFETAATYLRYSRYLLCQIYKTIYGNDTISLISKFLRLSRTLLVLDTIHQNYLLQKNEPVHRYHFVLEMEIDNYVLKNHKPWHLVHRVGGYMTTCCSTKDLYCPQLNVDGLWKATSVGPLFGDIVWMIGKDTGPFFYATQYFNPVISFSFPRNGISAIDNLYINKSKDWSRFMWLIRYCYGKDTGLFIVTPNADSDDEGGNIDLEFLDQ